MFKMSTVFILHFVPSLRFTLSLNFSHNLHFSYPWSVVCSLQSAGLCFTLTVSRMPLIFLNKMRYILWVVALLETCDVTNKGRPLSRHLYRQITLFIHGISISI